MRPALLIMGPTASGKSALALRLAAALDGEIVNADSMQVYADLRVLTARPSPADEAQAPHHLYGVVDAAERFSVGRWAAAAARAVAAIQARGRLPIVVGGTGLYFKALTEGLAAAPPGDAAVRAALHARLEAEGPAALHAMLQTRDPDAAAKLSPQDAPRILRALEVVETTGRPLGAWIAAQPPPALAPGAWCGLRLAPDRAALYAAIDARVTAMARDGALEEVRRLADRRLDPLLPCMKAHGAPALMAHLRGELDLEAALDVARQDTRNYAKRQFTWMRGQMPAWPSVAPERAFDAAQALVEEINPQRRDA